MANNTTTTANALIQEQVSSMLVEPLEAESVVLASSPNIFNSSEPLRIPTLTAGFEPGWVGENEEISSDGAANFGEIKLMPSNRKSIKKIVRVSNELIRQAQMGVSAVLQQRLVKDVADSLDDALLMGTGAGDTITGLINQAGVQAAPLDLDGTDTFLDALAMAAAKEVKPNRFFVNGSDFFTIRKIKDTNGRYIMQSDVSGEAAYQLFGVPVTVTNKLPKGKAVLADMNHVAVVRDIDPQVTILNERYAEFDQVGIRVTTRYDMGLLHPESVIVMTAGE